MFFNSEIFIAFCALFFPVYFQSKSPLVQNAVTFLASLVFYGWWNWKLVFLICASIFANYLAGILLGHSRDQFSRKILLLAAISFNLALLTTFKYVSFLMDSITQGLSALGMSMPEVKLEIILPVGISFFTFQAMSYIIDIYRGRIDCESSLIRFSAYISLFPQLVAGPIVRSDVLLPQLRLLRKFSWSNFWLGLEMFIIGAALKIVVANRLAPVVDQVYGQHTQQDPLSLLIATLFFAFQIYGDFAGYSLMAIGIGRVMGLRFPFNFRRPYMASGFSDFWRRWHISLSTWLRDYLYVPLGGNRTGKILRARNVMTTMLLGGLWHGASWTFVFWGFLHGSYQVLQATKWGKTILGAPAPNCLKLLGQRVLVFLMVCIAWVYFRVPNFSEATDILVKILDFGSYSIAAIGNKVDVGFGVCVILVLVGIEVVCEDTHWLKIYRRNRLVRLAWMLALVQILILFGSFSDAAFIYFQF